MTHPRASGKTAPPGAANPDRLRSRQLIEVKKTRQFANELRRRWFASEEQDLYIWQDDAGAIASFQLCYAKYRKERALYWRRQSGFAHLSVDDGESGRGFGTPILQADGSFEVDAVLRRFLDLSAELPPEIVDFVSERIRQYPATGPSKPGPHAPESPLPHSPP